MSESRKLAAILVADVVGYSRLASADEERTLARLRGLRSDLIDPAIAAHHGYMVKRTGDGFFTEFRSVVDAVRCAIEVQTGMVERNAGLPPERRIEFRVGIHLGDVVEEADGDLMGDGINVAARLEGICEPGGICLSEDAWRQVREKLHERFVDLGEKTLKNIAHPVRAYALSAAQVAASSAASLASVPPQARGVLVYWQAIAAAFMIAVFAAGAYAWNAGYAPRLLGASSDDKLAHAPRLSIVVLPFENLSGDKEQDYFADGITDDLTTDLSHLQDSFVISRGTAFTYKGKPIDAKEVGRQLGARYLLEGSVRRLGDKIEVNAQLISTETGAHVWADRFETERSKLGELQVDIVARLANSLGVALVKAEALRAARERPNNPDAVDLAMQGWASINSGFSKANFYAAIDYFERALRLDPELTQAQIGLAWMLVDRVTVFGGGNEAVDYPRAEALLTSALSKEPNNARAHSVKGYLLSMRKQFNEAMSEQDAAIEDDRNYALAYGARGLTYIMAGRAAEAISEEETALRLSPRDPLHGFWEHHLCHAYAHLAEWEKAVEWCHKALATNVEPWIPYVDLAAANGWLGNEAGAKAAVAGLLNLKPGFTVQDWANIRPSDDPQFQREYARIAEGLRKAGLPEGEKKTN
jgi:adenylate cyclase